MGRYVLSSMHLATTFRHLIIGRLRWLLATGDERDAEILALRHQILVLQRQINRPCFTDADRTILGVLSTVFARVRASRRRRPTSDRWLNHGGSGRTLRNDSVVQRGRLES